MAWRMMSERMASVMGSISMMHDAAEVAGAAAMRAADRAGRA